MGNTQGSLDFSRIAGKCHLSQEEILQLASHFLASTDKGKPVTRARFNQLIRSWSERHSIPAFQNEAYFDRIFDMLDANHDGHIEIEEFVVNLSVITAGSVQEKAELAFKAYDRNGDGSLSRKELEAIIEKSLESKKKALKASWRAQGKSSKEIDSLLNREVGSAVARNLLDSILLADTNQDGVVSKEEWLIAAETNPVIQRFLYPGGAFEQFVPIQATTVKPTAFTAENIDSAPPSEKLQWAMSNIFRTGAVLRGNLNVCHVQSEHSLKVLGTGTDGNLKAIHTAFFSDDVIHNISVAAASGTGAINVTFQSRGDTFEGVVNLRVQKIAGRVISAANPTMPGTFDLTLDIESSAPLPPPPAAPVSGLSTLPTAPVSAPIEPPEKMATLANLGVLGASIYRAQKGDELILKPGVFYESIVLTGEKDVTLRAETPGSVYIIGTMITGPAVTVTGGTPRLEGIVMGMNKGSEHDKEDIHFNISPVVNIVGGQPTFSNCQITGSYGVSHSLVAVSNARPIFDHVLIEGCAAPPRGSAASVPSFPPCASVGPTFETRVLPPEPAAAEPVAPPAAFGAKKKPFAGAISALKTALRENDTGIQFKDMSEGILKNSIVRNLINGIKIRSHANPTIESTRVIHCSKLGILSEENGNGQARNCELLGSRVTNIAKYSMGTFTLVNCFSADSQYGALAERKGILVVDTCIFKNNNRTLELKDATATLKNTATGDSTHAVLASEGSILALQSCETREIEVRSKSELKMDKCQCRGPIRVQENSKVDIKEITLSSCHVGLLMNESSGTITKSVIQENDTGIMIEGGNVNIRDSKVHSCRRVGVVVRARGAADFKECAFQDTTGIGLSVEGNSAVNVFGSVFRGHTDSAIVYESNSTGLVNKCELSRNERGIEFGQQSFPTIRGSVIKNNFSCGILAANKSCASIDECEISENYHGGILIEHEGNPVIRFCKISLNGFVGIASRSLGQGVIQTCEISNNDHDPIVIEAGCTTNFLPNSNVFGNGLFPGRDFDREALGFKPATFRAGMAQTRQQIERADTIRGLRGFGYPKNSRVDSIFNFIEKFDDQFCGLGL